MYEYASAFLHRLPMFATGSLQNCTNDVCLVRIHSVPTGNLPRSVYGFVASYAARPRDPLQLDGLAKAKQVMPLNAAKSFDQ